MTASTTDCAGRSARTSLCGVAREETLQMVLGVLGLTTATTS
jgi:hypothetical protein